MTRTMIVAALALAAAGPVTTDVFNAETGQREGRVAESPGGSVDVFDRDSGRIGWGRTDASGTQLFDPQGNRIGTITPTRGGTRSLWLNAPSRGKGGAGRK